MSLLYLHTQLLESLDWDEDALNEAIKRTTELYASLNVTQPPTVYELKKGLKEEYAEDVVEKLISFFEAAQVFEQQLKEDEGIQDD